MKRKEIFLWFLVSLGLLPLAAHRAESQAVDSTVYAKQFSSQGNTVGALVAAAVKSCPPAPCMIVLDPSLANWAQGTIPALGPNQYLIDWRSGSPFPPPVSVTSFGALGNCTQTGSSAACANNYSTLTAGFQYCKLHLCSLYFPINTANSTTTVYYSCPAIDPLGVSFFGPPGAGGYQNVTPSVEIRGCPGSDVMAVGDPASVGFVHPLSKFVVRDISFGVDDTADASSSGSNSFPNRLPGRTVYDLVCNTSNTSVTSNTAYFQPGDVGQNFIAYGCGAAGANLTTTIASFASSKSVALAVQPSTAQTGAHGYISVMGLSATQTIGNCAFAYDNAASGTVVDAEGSEFRDVTIQTVSGVANQNNSCGFLFQGNSLIYGTRFERIAIKAPFAFAFINSNQAVSSGFNSGLGGFNVFEHIWISSIQPWLSYQGAQNRIQDVELSNVQQGPNILAAYGITGYPSTWSVSIEEEEAWPWTGRLCPAGSTAYRFAGIDFLVAHLGMPECISSSMIFQWDANASNVQDIYLADISPINISGNFNSFRSSTFAAYAITWGVTGYGNTWVTCNSTSTVTTMQSGRCQYAGPSNLGLGPGSLSRGRSAFELTHDFIGRGAGNYYLNDEDMWLWPSDLIGYNRVTPAVQSDTASQSGLAYYISFATVPNPNYTMMWLENTPMLIGSSIPTGNLRIYFYAKASAAQNFYADAVYGASNPPGTSLGCNFKTTPMSLSTSYALYSCDVAISTSLLGDRFGIRLGLADAITSNVSIGWIAMKPWNSDMTASQATLGLGGSPSVGLWTGTGTLTYTSITAPGCQEQSLTITGAAAGDECSASTGASDIGTGFYYGGCRISAANTAKVKVCATATGTPSAVAWTGWARQ